LDGGMSGLTPRSVGSCECAPFADGKLARLPPYRSGSRSQCIFIGHYPEDSTDLGLLRVGCRVNRVVCIALSVH